MLIKNWYNYDGGKYGNKKRKTNSKKAIERLYELG